MNYIEKCSIIQPNYLKKRIISELNILKEANYINEYTYFHISVIKDKQYKINFTCDADQNIYTFLITDTYPFYPPMSVYINYIPYDTYKKIQSPYFINALFKYKNIKCFCCESILNPNKWSPHYLIKNIIQEFMDNKKTCLEISQRIIVDVIQRKYLNKDINILEWLF
jgi:hypothetical protein